MQGVGDGFVLLAVGEHESERKVIHILQPELKLSMNARLVHLLMRGFRIKGTSIYMPGLLSLSEWLP